MRCDECLLWVVSPLSETFGMCHRYPEAVRTDADHWCGEHRPNAVTLAKEWKRRQLFEVQNIFVNGSDDGNH